MILSLLPIVSQAQVLVAIQNLQDSRIYAKVNNNLAIVVSGFSGPLIVTTDNGTISKQDGYYNWRPEHAGRSMLTIAGGRGKRLDTFAIKPFFVKEFPLPILRLGGASNDTLSVHIAKLQVGPYAASYESGNYGDIVYKITGFTIIIIRKDEIVLHRKLSNDNTGVRFSDDSETQKAIENLEAGDKLLFCDIVCRGPGGVHRLAPVEFTITDQ